jgi:hypothetical protein
VQVKFLSLRCRGESIFPIGETDYQTDEAGVEGGNSKSDWESHRAEFNMDRNTNPRLNHRELEQAYTDYRPGPKRTRIGAGQFSV